MNLEDIRTYCLSKPGAFEAQPFGPDTLVFKAHDKAFLLMPLDEEGLRFNVKCDPELAIELRERHACVQPGYHMNKKHWNTILVDGSVSRSEILRWIDHSYALVTGPTTKKKKP